MKEIVRASDAPKAIGPYSHAVISSGELVYTAGQLGIDPATGELVGAGIEEQTRQALTNLAAVLRAAGSGLDKVVKTTVFLADMNDFAAMNEVYGKFFTTDPPARSAVQVARLPKGARVEIEAVATRG
ncbi:MAG: RidA family protein [Calditrichaeota bacterium]|nr:RidA family protein [Calditrichota bacterium]